MTERPPRALGSIVCRFPPWVTQEVAQVPEAWAVDALVDAVKRRQTRVRGLGMPAFVVLLGIDAVAALPGVIAPDAVPVGEETARELEVGSQRAVQQSLQLPLFCLIQMIGTTQQESASFLQVRPHRAHLLPTGP